MRRGRGAGLRGGRCHAGGHHPGDPGRDPGRADRQRAHGHLSGPDGPPRAALPLRHRLGDHGHGHGQLLRRGAGDPGASRRHGSGGPLLQPALPSRNRHRGHRSGCPGRLRAGAADLDLRPGRGGFRAPVGRHARADAHRQPRAVPDRQRDPGGCFSHRAGPGGQQGDPGRGADQAGRDRGQLPGGGAHGAAPAGGHLVPVFDLPGQVGPLERRRREGHAAAGCGTGPADPGRAPPAAPRA